MNEILTLYLLRWRIREEAHGAVCADAYELGETYAAADGVHVLLDDFDVATFTTTLSYYVSPDFRAAV